MGIQREIDDNRGDLRKTARSLGFNYTALVERFGTRDVVNTPDLGRQELRKYIVAYRIADRGWTSFQQEILEDARRKFDAGTHEMCQGRDGRYILQYLIPRLIPCGRRNFFGSGGRA